MNRFLSRVGIGSATVDLVLPATSFRPGERVEATAEVEGGDSDQRIEGLRLAVVAGTAGSRDAKVVDSVTVFDGFLIEAGESRSVPVEFTVPRWTPITRDDVEVWIETGLDIDWAVDPSDTDAIEVVPGPYVEALFTAVEELGFEYEGTTLEDADWLEGRPYVQEFEFVPGTDHYRERVDELEIVCVPEDERLRIVAEIDLVDAVADPIDADFDEQEIPMSFESPNAARIKGRLENELRQQTRE